MILGNLPSHISGMSNPRRLYENELYVSVRHATMFPPALDNAEFTGVKRDRGVSLPTIFGEKRSENFSKGFANLNEIHGQTLDSQERKAP